MTAAVAVALAAIAVTTMGWSLLALLLPRALPRTLVERLALGWLVGLVWLGWLVQLSLLLLDRLPIWLWPAATVVVPLALVRHWRAIAAHVRQPRGAPRRWPLAREPGAILPLAVLVGQCAYVLAASLSTGLGWDGLAVWAMKARALYWDTVQVPGSLSAFLLSPSWAFSNPEQPLALPALETWLYLWVGGVDERAAKIIAPLCLMALLAVLSAHLTRLLGAPRALSLACLLVLAPRLLELASTGYADVPLLALCGAAVAYAAQGLRASDPPAEDLAALLTAAMLLTKKDGLILAVCLVGAACVSLALVGKTHRAARFGAKCVVAAGVLAGPWLLFNLGHSIPVSAYLPVTPQTLAANAWRLVEIAPYLGYYLLAPKFYGLLWPALVLIAPLRHSRWRDPPVAFLLLFCGAALAADALTFVFSSWDPYLLHVTSALDRLVGHLAPAALLATGYLLADLSGTHAHRAPAAPATAPATAPGAPAPPTSGDPHYDRSTGPQPGNKRRAPRTAPGPASPQPAA